MDQLSLAQARRAALAAQGFTDRAPGGRVDARHLRRVLGRIKLLQLDAVNVVVRSHYLPLFSRLGPYPRATIDDLAYRRRELFEYWAHEASLLPVDLHPVIRWQMHPERVKLGLQEAARDRQAYVDDVLRQVRDRGPLAVRDLDDPGTRRGPWWGWADGKIALEWLFLVGAVTTAHRRGFERVYDLTERVLPPEVLDLPPLSQHESRRHLLALAGEALGVGTARDLCDYFRLQPARSRDALAELVDGGVLVPVRVEGWKQPAYLHRDARIPRRIGTAALLSPFDPVVWERSRTERLFDFHYRIEIYTPKPKRRFGYYVLPFLLGDRLVGRVDVKADRQAGVLVAHAAYVEPGADPAAVAPALHAELASMAEWLGLEPGPPPGLQPTGGR